jgi:alkylation response protein AidB-like acyl-CoA dehydrogenase
VSEASVTAEAIADLRSAVRSCLQRAQGPRSFMADANAPGGYDEDLYRALATEIGITDLLVPTRLGGSGASVHALTAVFEELGYALAAAPVFASAGLAAATLAAAASEGAATLGAARVGAAIANGQVVTAVLGPAMRDDLPIQARLTDGAFVRLTGRYGLVVEGVAAATILVPVIGPDGGSELYAVDASTPGITRRALTSLDLTRGFAEVSFDDAAGELIASGDSWPRAADAAWDIACVVLAAEQVGAAQRALDAAVAYARERVQFNRPIGSFQAIQHTLVDMLLAVEMARSAMQHAANRADAHLAAPSDDTRRELTLAAASTKATCSDAFVTVAERSLHVHGGIGFTWEHDAHLYLRRAITTQQILGTPAEHRERVALAAGL